MITDAMLAMFCLGLTAGTLGGAGLRGWWLARHSALLNEALRCGVTDQYAAMKDGRRADRLPIGRYADEEAA